jgi:hypothetical protein
MTVTDKAASLVAEWKREFPISAVQDIEARVEGELIRRIATALADERKTSIQELI